MTEERELNRMRMLLCTNGSADSETALRFGAHLATLLSLPVALLGVVETPGRRAVIQAQVDATASVLAADGIVAERQIVAGDVYEIIVNTAHAGESLTVLGSLGSPWWRRLVRGPTLRHILNSLRGPVLCLYQVEEPEALRHILICSGGLSQADAAVDLGGRIASAAGASVVLLHIATPLSNMPEPVRNVPAAEDEYLQGDAIFAHNLHQEMDHLTSLGVNAEFRLRSGDPLMEILNEIRTGSYDMVVIGSHAALTGPGYLVGDITHRIVEGARRPVLVVTGHQQNNNH